MDSDAITADAERALNGLLYNSAWPQGRKQGTTSSSSSTGRGYGNGSGSSGNGSGNGHTQSTHHDDNATEVNAAMGAGMYALFGSPATRTGSRGAAGSSRGGSRCSSRNRPLSSYSFSSHDTNEIEEDIADIVDDVAAEGSHGQYQWGSGVLEESVDDDYPDDFDMEYEVCYIIRVCCYVCVMFGQICHKKI